MKNCLLTGTLAIVTCCSLIGLAQDAAKPAKPAAAADKTDDKGDAKKGRLPANYGKLGLTDAQRTKIYAVQEKYDEQLDALEKQIASVKAKRDQEVEAALTDDQRKILKNLVDAAKESKTKGKQDPAEGAKTDAPKDGKK